MKNKLKSILSIEIPFLYLKKTLALVLIAGMVLTNGDFALLGHTVVEAAASSFKANGTSVDLDTPESWQVMANAEKKITDKSGVSQSVLGKAWLYGVVANEWNFDGESETNFAVKTLSGKAGQTGVTDKAKGDLSAESMVGESTTNGVVQIKGVPETLTLPKGQESKFFDSCNGLIYKYDTKQNIEAAIDAMRSHVAQQSDAMAKKNSIPDYSKVVRGDSAQKITLDFTESPEGTIYVNVDQWVVNSQWEVNDWSLSQAFKENGAITIKKKSNQIIVFNFSGSEVNLNKMIIEEGGKSQDTVGIANTPSSSNDIIEGLYFNMPNATKVHLQDSAGIFIAPKATVTTGGVGGGWLICDKLINGCEWHFTNGKLPDTYGKDSVQFHAVKNIAGKPADKDGFTFTLSEKDGNKWNTIQTKTNKGSAIDFDSIEYKYDTKNPDQEVKLYRISEEDKQTLNGVTYNAEKTDYYARVTLDKTSAAGQGNSNNYSVKASVAYYKDEACSQLIDTETPVFNNTEANGSLLVLKSVSGPKGFELTDDQKQAIVFTVSDSSGVIIASFTYKNMLDHSVTLPDGSVVQVTYEKGGVKLSNLTPGSYTVSENVDRDNDVAGYAHTTTVTVDGKEETKNSGTVKVESAKDASIAFKNSYAQASVELNGTKTIDGNTPKDQEFAFSLYEASKNEKSGDFEPGKPIQTVRNDGEGNFSFSTITYSKAGTYYYFILEEDPSQDDKGQETGIKKNTQKYLVTVVVQKNRDGSLTAEAPSYQEMASANGGSTKPSNTAAFQNTTEKSEGSISLSAKKELIGRNLKDGEFTFELVAADQDGKPITENGKEVILQSVTNGVKKADGSNNIQFEKITYQKDLYNGIDQRGTYYYIVREKQGTDSHIAYTKVTYLVRVNVTDSKTDGKLEVEKSIQLLSDGTYNKTAKATNTNKENIEFVNTYEAAGHYAFYGQKVLTGRSLKENEFSFKVVELINKDGKTTEQKVATAKNTADGSLVFDYGTNPDGSIKTGIDYSLDHVGTHTYKITEDKTTLGGIKENKEAYILTVDVKDNGKGALDVKTTSMKKQEDGKDVDGSLIKNPSQEQLVKEIVFHNVYKASGSISITGTKQMLGRKLNDWDKENVYFNMFIYGIYHRDTGKWEYPKDQSPIYQGGLKDISQDGQTATIAFGHYEMRDGKQVLVEEPITYTEKDANNVYIYRFSENIRGLENDQTKHGVTMDGSMGQAIVSIKDNGDGTLSVQEDSDFQGNHDTTKDPIKNTYHAFGELNLSGTKELIGKDLKQGDFKFTLCQTDKDGKELTDGYSETVSNAAPSTDMGANANGSTAGFAFRAIEYTEADAGKDFYYTVSEQAGDQASITYDGKVYQIHVKVTDNGDGTLKVERKDDVKQISFTNFYNASASLNLNLIKTINGKTVDESHVANLKDKKFTFTLTEMNGKGEKASPKKNGKTETITVSGKDGKASFSTLSYTLADKNQTYYYRIAEDASTSKMPKGFAKDGKDFYFSITVSDDGSGLLHLTSDSDAINDGMNGNTFTAKYALGHTFNNTYSASGELPVKGNKTINGLSPDKNVKDLFEFTLTEISVNDVPVEKPYTETVKTDKDGKFSFTSLKYSMNPDIANSPSGSVKYIYQIEETSYPKGYTKDTDPEYLEVTVSDHGDGTLSIQSTEPEAGYTFNNLYNAKGSITLKGKKTLHGRDMEADEFHFTVTETDDKGTALKVKNAEGKEVDKVVARGSNAAASAEQDADITFSSISYSDKSQVGKHYYTITEDPVDTDKGLSQNTEAYKVVVDVSDNGDGTLKAEATDRDGNVIDPEKDIHFINTYSAEGSITLKGSKTLVGRDMKDGEFTFTVREQNADGSYKKAADGTDLIVATGKNKEAKNGQAAAIDFTKISYKDITDIGTHTYEITEDPFQDAAEDGSKDGLQANSQKYIVQVEVSDNGDGTLRAEAIFGTNQDGQTIAPATGIAFTNTYKASGAITLNGSKKLIGRDMKAGEFSFSVREKNEDGSYKKAADGTDLIVATGKNEEAKNGQPAAIDFTKIDFDNESGIGTHTYVITEDPFQGAAEDGSKDGLQANTQRYIVQVEVSDNGDGTLKAEAVSATDQNGQTITPASGIVFTNNYKAYGSLDLLGTKTLEGRQLTTQDNFRFVVEEETRDAEGNVNRRQVSSAKLTQESIAADKQSAKLDFDRINYTLADVGTHTYKIHEVIPEAAEKIAGIKYDTSEYTLVVTVSDNKGDGTLTVETRDAAGKTVDVTKADTYSFKNSYAANGDITLTGSKTLVGRDMKDGEFTFTVREQNADGSYKKAADGTDLIVATGKNQAAKNGQPAAITFDPITYDSVEAVGTHTYEITEDPFQGAAEDGSKDGLQANSQKYIVQVEVSDNGDGTLKAEAISGTDADGETIDPATGIAFTNTYKASGDHSFYGTKTVAGRDLTPGEDYQFQVEEVITDEDGKENRVEVSTGHLNPDTIVGNHGDILFGTLHYTLADVGTHTYKIHEVIPADQDKTAGITYDKTEYTEIVTVSDKGDGSLEVVAKDADGNLINSGETKTYNFTNTYQNVAVRFTGSKTLTGGDIASYPGAFRFDLVDSDGHVIDTAKNDATGRFTFAPIYYEASDVGEHTYTIVEENAGRIINGIKYDDSEIPVTVTVENRAGKLVATGQVEGDEIAFHNEKLSEITVQKNWADDQNAANARPQQITVDLLQNEQVVRSAVLTGATDTWTYTFKDLTPGTYKVRERSDSPYYEVSYDKKILDLTDENGQAKDETVTITNTFERTVDLVAYKDLMGQALNDGQFRFVLHRNSDGDDTSHDLTTTNRGDGSISFYDVTYDPNGYTMYEVAEQSKYPHITFDEHNSIATGLRFDPEGNPITQEDGTALYTFKNVYRPIVLRVQKRSKSAPFDPLVGATYGLYRYSADGNDVLVEAQLSDSNGYMYYGKIEPGVIYYFKEISAPAGHEVDPYAGKHFQVKYTENGNIAVYDEDGNPDTTYGDITTMEDKTEGYRTTEIIKEKNSLDEIQANEQQSRYAYTGNGVDAVAIADKGAFPEGTTMVVTPLTGDRLAEVETLLENNVGQFNTMAFYDITFTDADGKEVEPAFGDVDVIIQPEVGLDTKGIELKNLKLIHLIDDGDPESTVKTVSLVTGSIAAEEKDGEEKLTQTKITSKSFSVFGLIDPKDSTLGNNYLLTANGVGDFVSKLKVAKLDTQGNFIPNATLDVYTFDPKKKDGIGERVIRWTTAEGCQYLQRILNVETPYVLVETNAPDGYAIADNIIFSIGRYDSSITCYTLKDGKLTASEKETQLHTNGSELIMVDDPITVMNKTDYKIIPQVKELTRDREITVPGAPKTGDQPIIPLVVILLAGIIGFAGIEIEKRRKNREEKQK